MDALIERLTGVGVAVWLEDPAVSSLARVREEGLSAQGPSGLSLGPLSLREALADQLALAGQGTGPDSAQARPGGTGAWEVMVPYAQYAADLFRPVYDTTDGAEGRISLGLRLGSAPNCADIVAAVSGTWAQAARPNIRLKVPATEAGLAAAMELLAAGISLDMTLIYSAGQVRAAMAAIADGFERAIDRGRDLPLVAATVSFSVCEVDTEVDKRLWSIGSDVAGRLRGTAALAFAYAAYEAYETCLGDERWRKLASFGVRAPGLVWTSVQVRDPYYLEAKYVQGLGTQGVVVSLNERTREMLADEPLAIADTGLRERYAGAHQALDALTEIGIDCADVAASLQSRGSQALAASWGPVRDGRIRSGQA